MLLSINRDFSSRLEIRDILIDRCESCLEFYFLNHSQISSSGHLDLFGDKIGCTIDDSDWGIFKVLNVASHFKKDTITKKVLVGKKGNGKNPALYLTDLGEELKVTGNTKIEGDMLLPKNGYKKINILGNNSLNKPLINGSYTISDQMLPEIQVPEISLSSNGKRTPYSKFKNTSAIYNGFDQNPLIIDLDAETLSKGASFKGKIILVSKDTITIREDMKLQDVIVSAPKVIVEDNFVGRIQIFANKEIEFGENVYLEYPSCAIVWSDPSFFDKLIHVSNRTKVEGPIILGEPSKYASTEGEITVDEGATIIGDLYCRGRLQLKGTVLGSVYTNKFLLKTKNGEYTNTLMNATIDAQKLSEQQLGFVLLNRNGFEKVSYGIVKQL